MFKSFFSRNCILFEHQLRYTVSYLNTYDSEQISEKQREHSLRTHLPFNYYENVFDVVIGRYILRNLRMNRVFFILNQNNQQQIKKNTATRHLGCSKIDRLNQDLEIKCLKEITRSSLERLRTLLRDDNLNLRHVQCTVSCYV